MNKIRIREMNKTMQYGKIFKNPLMTLQKCGIFQNAHILCDLLSEPIEKYPDNSFFLYLKKRDITNKSYLPIRMEFIEFPGPYPTLEDLKKGCAKIFDLDPEKMSVAKFVQHQFKWQKILPPPPEGSNPTRRQKKKSKALNDISQPPYLLKESGIF